MKRFLLTVACAGVCALQAQTANPLSGEIKQTYTGIKNNLTKLASKISDEDYNFKATPDIRTLGQLIAHVADSQSRTCAALAGGDAKPVSAASKTTKADLVAALNQSFAICDQVVNSLTDASAMEMIKTPRGERTRAGALMALIAHSDEEYGYMSVYLRLKGEVPPSSEGR